MTTREKIQQQLDQINDRIIELTASAAPDTTIAGRTISTGAYLNQLLAAQKQLQQQLAQSQPYEVRTFAAPW